MIPLSKEEQRIKNQILSRDLRDQETARKAKLTFAKAGLKTQLNSPILNLKTDDSPGPLHNAEVILKHLKTNHPGAKVITIEGASGSGKSETSRHLNALLSGCMVSLGEIFRLLTWHKINSINLEPEQILARISLVENNGQVEIWEGEINLSQNLAKELRGEELEKLLPEVAEAVQIPVIQFVSKELSRLKNQTQRPFVIEGRGYHLPYFPADLRIRLEVDLEIRAKRRAKQTK
jgi:cytidylate kinase